MKKINQSAMWKIWHDFLHSILRLKKETGRYCAWQCWQQNLKDRATENCYLTPGTTTAGIFIFSCHFHLSHSLESWWDDQRMMGGQKTTHVVEVGLTGMYDTLIHPWHFWWSMLKEWWASDPQQCESWKKGLGKKRDEAKTAMLTQGRMPGRC